MKEETITFSKGQDFISDLRQLFHKLSIQEYGILSSNWYKTIRNYYNKNIHPEVKKLIGR